MNNKKEFAWFGAERVLRSEPIPTSAATISRLAEFHSAICALDAHYHEVEDMIVELLFTNCINRQLYIFLCVS